MKKLIKEGVCSSQTPVRTETFETVVGGRRMCVRTKKYAFGSGDVTCVKTKKYAFGGECMICDPIRKVR